MVLAPQGQDCKIALVLSTYENISKNKNMSTKTNDDILELLNDYWEGNIISEEEFEKGKLDLEYAHELISVYAKDYDMWCDEGELTRKGDWEESNKTY